MRAGYGLSVCPDANYFTARIENWERPMYEGNYEGRQTCSTPPRSTQYDRKLKPQPIFPGYQESTFKIGAQLGEAYLGTKTPEEALAQAEDEANAVLADIDSNLECSTRTGPALAGVCVAKSDKRRRAFALRLLCCLLLDCDRPMPIMNLEICWWLRLRTKQPLTSSSATKRISRVKAKSESVREPDPVKQRKCT